VGEGLVKTKDQEINVKSGDVLVFPPREEGLHKITNSSESAMLVYLDVGTKELLDVVHYPDSQKIGVIKHNELSKFYMEDDVVGYYQDEE